MALVLWREARLITDAPPLKDAHRQRPEPQHGQHGHEGLIVQEVRVLLQPRQQAKVPQVGRQQQALQQRPQRAAHRGTPRQQRSKVAEGGSSGLTGAQWRPLCPA